MGPLLANELLSHFQVMISLTLSVFLALWSLPCPFNISPTKKWRLLYQEADGSTQSFMGLGRVLHDFQKVETLGDQLVLISWF